MELLDYVSEHQGQALNEIASELKQSPATVYRTLVTLEGRGMVEFDRESQTWFMGARAFVIGARFLRRTSTVERARPILRRLMEATGETANLGIVQRDQVLFVSQVETHTPIRAFFPPGTVSPFHASGIGKALLSHMAPDALEAVLKAPLERFTPKTLVTREELLKDLERTRARGYALDDEEKNLGMLCIAAPVFNNYQEAIAGISVSGPIARMDAERIQENAREVVEAAAMLTDAIGGIRPASGK